MCPLPSGCRNALEQSIEELGCCAYSYFTLSGMNSSIVDMLWDVCGFPQSVAYVCNSTTDASASNGPPDPIDSTPGTTDSAHGGVLVPPLSLLFCSLLILTVL